MTIEGKEVEWDEGFRDFASFLHGISETGSGLSVTCMEVPLDVFVAAQEAGTLASLEIAVDDAGLPFLMGMVHSDGHQAILVSVSFVAVPEVETLDADAGLDGFDGEVMTDGDPRLS